MANRGWVLDELPMVLSEVEQKNCLANYTSSFADSTSTILLFINWRKSRNNLFIPHDLGKVSAYILFIYM